MVSPSRRPLVSALARYDRLLEVGIGNRPAVARAVAERGCDVVGVDIEVGERTREAERSVTETADSHGGSFRVVEGDVHSLADSGTPGEMTRGELERLDAVYACHLPAELQGPTLALAERVDAACLFTTLGFEEPVVAVDRRSTSGTTLYVARGRGDHGPNGPSGPGDRN